MGAIILLFWNGGGVSTVRKFPSRLTGTGERLKVDPVESTAQRLKVDPSQTTATDN